MAAFLRKILRSLASGMVFASVMYGFQRIAVGPQGNYLTVVTEFVVYCIVYATIDFLAANWFPSDHKER